MNEWVEQDLSVLTAKGGWHAEDPVMMEKLETSLKRFGQLAPLIVKDNEVLGGRRLFRAMQNIGWQTAMAVRLSGDIEPLHVSLATEIRFDTDYAALSKAIGESLTEAHSLARISPFSAARIEYFKKLIDFDWSQFKEGDDQQSLWDEGDLIKPKGQAPSPKVTTKAPVRVTTSEKKDRPVTPRTEKNSSLPKPAPPPRPSPLVRQVTQAPPVQSLRAPQSAHLTVPSQPVDPELVAFTQAVSEVVQQIGEALGIPVAELTRDPGIVIESTVVHSEIVKDAKPSILELLDEPQPEARASLTVQAPPPPARTAAAAFAGLVDRPVQSSLVPSVIFAGDEGPRVDPNWKLEPLPSLDGVSEIDFDTETDGLRWFKGDRPIGMAVRRPDGSKHYIAFGHRGGNNCDEGTAKRWAQRELRNKHLTGANIRFDIHQMREWGVDLEDQGCTLSDVLHMAPLLDDRRRKWSLDTVAEEYKVLRKTGQDLDKARMADYHASIVAPYAMNDVEMTHLCKQAMWPKLDAEDMHMVRMLEESIIYAVCEMEKNAAPIDVDLLYRWLHESEAEINTLLKELVEGCGFMMDPDKDSSWVRLFEKLGLPITHFTEHGAPSFADGIIKHIKHPLVQKARRVGKLKSLRSKFLLPYADDVREYGMVRFNLHQLRGDKNGTVRGRFSASDQNIQQVFNDKNQRKAFGFDEDDSSHDDEIYLIRKLFKAGIGEYLSADAMQIEYRIMAARAGDPRMLKAYADNPLLSYHELVWDMVRPFKADIIYGKVKILNFMLMYGGGKDKTAETLEMSRSESDAFVDLYKQTFPYTDKLFKSVMAQAENEGFVTTLLGRRARFPGGKFSHAALNAVIQGTAADIMKMKIAELHAARKKTGFVMRMTVHDEVCGDSPDQKCKEMVNEILNAQSVDLPVPILWKTATGPNWAAC